MKIDKNNIPLYAEEQFINEEKQIIQQILNRDEFKQPIPSNFVKLKVEEGNYMGSTNPKWKDKPLCERYGFHSEEGEWMQIDISRELMEILEITEGEDITHPLYLDPDVSKKKKPIRGAYTIEKEEELFIDKPVSEKNAEKELVKRMKELDSLRKKIKVLENDDQLSQETITNLQCEVADLEDKLNDVKKELKEIKDKKRDWTSFVDWLDANFINKAKWEGANKMRIAGKIYIEWLFKDIWREDKEDYYIKSADNSIIYWLLFKNAKGFEDKQDSCIIWIDFFSGWTPLPYEENKSFRELFILRGKHRSTKEIIDSWERLFLTWKSETPLWTATE